MARTLEIQSRERLTWGMMIAGFSCFFLMLLAIPIGINAALENATIPLAVEIEAEQGTVSVNNERAISPDGVTQMLDEGDRVRTDFPTTAVLTLHPDDEQLDDLIGRVQISRNGVLDVQSIRQPRFRFSERGYEVEMAVGNGYYSLILAQEANWQLQTPHAQITIREAGQYQLNVTEAGTQLSVQSGTATLVTLDGLTNANVTATQRAQLTDAQQIEGPFTPTTDLIEDGAFRQSLNDKSRWQMFPWNVELADQPQGEVRQIATSEGSYLQVEREGVGHADISFTQAIKYEVPPFQAERIRLQITFRLLGHSLDVCGFQGSECPLFIQLGYQANGTDRTWQQGFYGVSATGSTTPYACFSCDVVQTAHERVLLGETTTYSVRIADIAALDSLPQTLDTVTVVTSGHSFAVEVLDVSLVLEEE